MDVVPAHYAVCLVVCGRLGLCDVACASPITFWNFLILCESCGYRGIITVLREHQGFNSFVQSLEPLQRILGLTLLLS